MRKDSAPAIYITRPCYNNNINLAHCRPWFWTQGRYSETVVNNMLEAVNQEIQYYQPQSVSLFGHSGGGVIAYLLALRLNSVGSITTVASDLDIDAWTRLHGYSPLEGSLNPARLLLSEKVKQNHFLGARDRNVPAAIFPFKHSPPMMNVHILNGADHECCWESHWKDILQLSAEQDAEVTR